MHILHSGDGLAVLVAHIPTDQARSRHLVVNGHRIVVGVVQVAIIVPDDLHITVGALVCGLGLRGVVGVLRQGRPGAEQSCGAGRG